ncbi:Interleukin-1 receptor-like 2 [Labeo rohita]|uniref:Interleukin-1 receptor-like 2 n=1 Tax=Labeo rohita TaxID=84645 RepID=A0ABQ8L8H9_LABRO|nr:Interleukin-1 receptor-like 2 [Labeo rohita]
MEGDSVTLNTGDTDKQKDYQILWKFGHNSTLIAKINRKNNETTFYNNNADGRFRDRLELDQTGSLTITNTRTTDSGLYQVTSIRAQTPLNRFSLTVYVVNVSDVSLSWYKGNSLLSSISVSDLNISLSLPLEVGCQDKNTYSCVINNPISNQTTHLNISEFCQTCAGGLW